MAVKDKDDKDGPDDGPGRNTGNGKSTNNAGANDRSRQIERTFRYLLRQCKQSGKGGAGENISDAVSQALVAVMGSVPSYAVGETMISASHSNGLMYENAVAQQQKTNVVGMVATVGCVAQLLQICPEKIWNEVEADPDEEG